MQIYFFSLYLFFNHCFIISYNFFIDDSRFYSIRTQKSICTHEKCKSKGTESLILFLSKTSPHRLYNLKKTRRLPARFLLLFVHCLIDTYLQYTFIYIQMWQIFNNDMNIKSHLMLIMTGKCPYLM